MASNLGCRILVLWLAVGVCLGGCAASQEEVDVNKARLNTFETLNARRTYEPVRITGIRRIEGDNITIVTVAELERMDVPDIQYDTSDTELLGKLIDGTVAIGLGVVAVGGIKALGDSLEPTVVTQPAPVIVNPVIVP